MRLLQAAKPEAVTGEVFCGSHRRATWSGDGTFRVDVMCIKPANHDSVCSLASVKAFRKIQVEDKAIDETDVWGAHGNPRKDDFFWDLYGGRPRQRYEDWSLRPEEYIMGWDMAARGSVDGTSYAVMHPDTGVQIEVTKEDFNSIWKRTDGSGGYDGSNASIVQFVREVLSRYE